GVLRRHRERPPRATTPPQGVLRRHRPPMAKQAPTRPARTAGRLPPTDSPEGRPRAIPATPTAPPLSPTRVTRGRRPTRGRAAHRLTSSRSSPTRNRPAPLLSPTGRATASSPRRRSPPSPGCRPWNRRSEEHTSELQSRFELVCRLLLDT